MNILFVCTENVARSRLAEERFRELQGRDARHVVRSVGTARHAARRLTTRDLAWAEVIAVMEPVHAEVIRTHWPQHADKVLVLHISDDFLPRELELREALESKLRTLLARCDVLGGEVDPPGKAGRRPSPAEATRC
jgi:predicted protein tyrosine phosphatase